MDARLIISSGKGIIFSFLMRGDEIKEIKVEKRESPHLIGSIFKGKVRRVNKSLDGAFLDIGLGKEAYLPFKEISENGKRPSLKAGDQLIVQMKREPIDEKGAKLTGKISLPGKYMIYLPFTKGVFVSSKIESEEERTRYQKIINGHLKNDGVIIRTCARRVSEESLLYDLERLKQEWNDILKRSETVKTGILKEEKRVFFQIIRDHWQDIKEIVVDDSGIWQELVSWADELYPELVERIRYVKNMSLFFKRFDLDRALTRLFARYVWLKGGGYIVIEETEAMTVIDVNSGSGCGDSLEENALSTNLEAAREIAKQIRLRDIGGIIIIDFIDMKEKKNRDTLLGELKKLFAEENSKVHIYGLTQLGLLEMTRRKETPSVTRLLSVDCPFCKGRGYLKSPEVVLYEIEKEIGYFKGRYLELKVSPHLKERVEKLIESKNLKNWVSVKEECDVPLDYYEMLISG